MLFNSAHFLVFFPTVVTLYFLIPHKFRWVLLLVASYYFYMAWEATYLALILISTVVDFLVAQFMGVEENKSKRKLLLWISICTNLGILGFFKYYNFFIDNFNELLVWLNMDYMIPASTFLLPMGISFYTFQTMAYTIDVYNRKISTESHPGYFALYVCYFPQLVAGPIERAQNLLPELKKKVVFEYQRVADGLKQMLWGFFKKMVIADRISVIVNMAYAQPESYDGSVLLLATFCFAFQIYCDFSGYSDIAIGASKVLGIKLMDNFRTPYLSRNISEFWSRWHISLSTWFRDYMYIPLGGNRVIKWRWYYNLMVVFLVSGFWHGANWTFIVWGFLHGAYLILAIIFLKFNHWWSTALGFKQQSPFTRFINVIITFILVLISWVYFRAESVADANFIAQKITFLQYDLDSLISFILENGQVKLAGILGILFIFVFVDPFMDKLVKGKVQVSKALNYAIYASIAALILIAGNFGKVDFIYFQF